MTPTSPSGTVPGRPLGVAILAVLVGIVGFLFTVLGILVLAKVAVSSYLGQLPSVIGETGFIAGAIVLVLGLIILGLAVGLWHLRMWALVLTLLVLVFELVVYGYAGAFASFPFVIALVLFVYLLAVHKHFD